MDAILIFVSLCIAAPPDERENSDSGFTEIESSRASQDDCNSDDLFSSPDPRPYEHNHHHHHVVTAASSSSSSTSFMRVYSEETIRDCSFPQAPTTSCTTSSGVGGIENGSSSNNTFEEDDEYDSDSNSSSVSRLSGLTHLSGCGEDDETPLNPWLRKQIISGVSPRDLLAQLVNSSDIIPHSVSDITLWKIIANTFTTPRRQKLKDYHTLDHAVDLLKSANNIIVLTGAGVSVSCGIPDFRSRDGIYSRLSKEYPDLPDPQAMFDIRYFFHDPRPFFKFAREIYPGQFKPSPCHTFIKALDAKGKLLRNYTQNIDTLEQVAGIRNVIECHGSFATASCTKCKRKVAADEIRDDVFNQRIPICHVCNPGVSSPDSHFLSTNPEETRSLVERGIMKPDIVFFGEGLPEVFHDTIESDRNKCDLLIVIGSSLKVRPVAMIPNWISPNVPQILINREPLYHMDTFDINLLGNSDVIAQHLCSLLGDEWNCSEAEQPINLVECSELLPPSAEDTNSTTVKASAESATVAPQPDATPSTSKDSEPATSELAKLIESPEKGKTSDEFEDSDDDSDFDIGKHQPQKVSLAERLPENSYYKLAQRVYIFQGAEVYMNSDDEDDEYDDDDDSETEAAGPTPSSLTPATVSPEKEVPECSNLLNNSDQTVVVTPNEADDLVATLTSAHDSTEVAAPVTLNFDTVAVVPSHGTDVNQSLTESPPSPHP